MVKNRSHRHGNCGRIECSSRLFSGVECAAHFDDHLNNIIYQALSSNSSISIVIFGNYDKPIYKIDDKRIYKIHGEIESKKIHYFKYIVDEFIPNLNENKDSNILKEFIEKLSETKEKEL